MNQSLNLIEKNRQQTEQISQQAELIQQLFHRIDELTNSLALLKEENQQLKDEIAVLKGQKPRPKISPSKLEGPQSKDKDKEPPIRRGKHPRKKKKTLLKIHQEQIIQPTSIPEGAIFKGYKSYDVQESFSHLKTPDCCLPDGGYQMVIMYVGKSPKASMGIMALN